MATTVPNIQLLEESDRQLARAHRIEREIEALRAELRSKQKQLHTAVDARELAYEAAMGRAVYTPPLEFEPADEEDDGDPDDGWKDLPLFEVPGVSPRVPAAVTVRRFLDEAEEVAGVVAPASPEKVFLETFSANYAVHLTRGEMKSSTIALAAYIADAASSSDE